MDTITLILTAVGTVTAIIAANVSLFFWSRSESRSDFRLVLAILQGIKDEMKDFHGRLCAIEEKNKNKN